jgi:hypothetical protein
MRVRVLLQLLHRAWRDPRRMKRTSDAMSAIGSKAKFKLRK